jgi:PAS domain S-box-containing protein
MTVSTSQHTVLVVEDTQDIVMGLKDLLEHDGYAVTVAGTCASAIELVRTQHINAILLDLTLPDGDGLEVMKAAHSLDPTLPVIIVTANTSTDKTVGSLTRGAFNYLIKPYNKEELRQTLRRAIGVKDLAVKVERVQHLLSESEDRFRSLVESATDAIIVANGGGIIISWNRSASVLFGYSSEEAIGQPLTLLMPQRYRDAHERGLARMASTGKGRVMGSVVELHGLKKDGTEFPIELSLATWRNTESTYYSGIIRDISERKKTEHVLRESQERFRQLSEHIGEVFWMTDPTKQQMLYISSGYEKIWGRSCESLYASPQSWVDAIHPEDRARVVESATHKQVIGTYDEQYRILRPDGTIRWIYDRAFPIRDSSGIVYRIVGFAEDITDQKRLQESLRASEERLDLVIQGSNDGFWDGQVLPGEPWRSPRTPVWWSLRVKTMLGYSDEEFPDVLESWASRLHPEDTERVFAALTAHIERHEPYDTEYRLLTKAGEYRWFRARGQAIWDDAGQFIRMSGSLQCVTDRKLAEEALRRHEQLLQEVIDNTTAVIYVKYADGRYLLTNRRFEQIFNLTTEQILGHTDHEIFPKDIADAFRANDVAVLERNTTVEYEEYAPHPDGLHAYISIKFPLCNHTGKPYATCGISTDITERKRTEDELRVNEAQVRLALLAAPVGLWGWDVQSDYLYWSPQVDTFLGVTPGSFRGTQNELLALIYPDDRDAILLALRRALEPRRVDVVFEHRVLWPDGTIHRLTWAGHIVRDLKGSAVRMLGTVHEQTPRGG